VLIQQLLLFVIGTGAQADTVGTEWLTVSFAVNRQLYSHFDDWQEYCLLDEWASGVSSRTGQDPYGSIRLRKARDGEEF
jgi:hypothetical protein